MESRAVGTPAPQLGKGESCAACGEEDADDLSQTGAVLMFGTQIVNRANGNPHTRAKTPKDTDKNLLTKK